MAAPGDPIQIGSGSERTATGRITSPTLLSAILPRSAQAVGRLRFGRCRRKLGSCRGDAEGAQRAGGWIVDGPCPLSWRTIQVVIVSDHSASGRLAAICSRI